MARNRRSVLERVLGIFAEVKPGEGIGVVLLFLNIFLILTAYYVLKVVREALTIGGVELFGLEGDEIKAYLSAAMAVLLLGIVPAYGYLASRVGRIQLIRSTMLGVCGFLVLFFLWGRTAGVGTAIGLSFFIWLGIVNVFLIAQFWSFANDVYDERQGKRLFAIIAIGQSLGAVLGPRLAKMGADHTFVLMIVSGGILLGSLILFSLVDRLERRSGSQTAEKARPLTGENGFQLVLQTRYLLLIALMILTTNVVNTTGEFILSNAAKLHSREQVPVETLVGVPAGTDEDQLTGSQRQELKDRRSSVVGRFYGDFFFYVNIAGLLIQMLLVSRIFKYFGVRAALFVLPVVAFGGYAAIGLLGGLTVLRVAKTAENSIDYSLQNTVKQALFLPTSREAKYKAKQAIDTFFVRFGDAASAGIVWLGLHALDFDARSFAFVNLVLCVVWILLSLGIAREHRRLVPDESA